MAEDDPLIARALEKIALHENEAIRLKVWVNGADTLNGAEPRFPDVTAPVAGATGAAPVRSASKRWAPGEFLGKPFSTAARAILLARHEAANQPSPASVDDIHEALQQGTFDFGANGAEAQKQSIRISLGKNSAAFVRLPSTDLFGLVEWYPGLRKAKPGRKPNDDAKDTTSATPETAGEEAAAEPPAAEPPTA
jgi:hypothetical protein